MPRPWGAPQQASHPRSSQTTAMPPDMTPNWTQEVHRQCGQQQCGPQGPRRHDVILLPCCRIASRSRPKRSSQRKRPATWNPRLKEAVRRTSSQSLLPQPSGANRRPVVLGGSAAYHAYQRKQHVPKGMCASRLHGCLRATNRPLGHAHARSPSPTHLPTHPPCARPCVGGGGMHALFRFWHDEQRFKGTGHESLVQRALLDAGGRRCGGPLKHELAMGPWGWQRMGAWDLLWSPASTAHKVRAWRGGPKVARAANAERPERWGAAGCGETLPRHAKEPFPCAGQGAAHT